jgi:hypothetical protein
MKPLLRHLAALAALVALVLAGGAGSHADAAAAAPVEVSAAQLHAPHDAPELHHGAAAQECAPAAVHCSGAGAILGQSTLDPLFRSAVRLRLTPLAQALAPGLPAEAETPPPRA